MTAPSNANTSGLYLLMKRGLYYRPDAMGYTGIKDHAGRYSKDDAEDHADPAAGVTMVSEAEAAEFSPNCFDDLARAHLLKQRDAEKARADRLAEIASKLSAAISWLDYPFIDNRTPEAELRQRVGFMMKDAEPHRAALQQETQP